VRVIRETTLLVECENEEQAKDIALEEVNLYDFEYYIDILDDYEVTP